MRGTKLKTLLFLIFIMTSSSSLVLAIDEENALVHSPNFIYNDLPRKIKGVEGEGQVLLKVYKGVTFSVGNKKTLRTHYDYKWVLLDTRYLPKDISSKQADKHTVYWKGKQIQAYTVSRYYPNLGRHQITDIFDRKIMIESL